MPAAVLLTECLQDDFVRPLAAGDTLPNRLHVGRDEARRLMGDDPADGPVARVLRWAYGQSARHLGIVHVRDRHQPDDPLQQHHLAQFGPHCLDGTAGFDFAFPPPPPGRSVSVVDAPDLNDFARTNLADVLAAYTDRPMRFGITGVWTEAKVLFLAYELRSRFPDARIAVCSALTASSSYARHLQALDQLDRLLGVEVHRTLGEFTGFLTGEAIGLPTAHRYLDRPLLAAPDGLSLGVDDAALLRFLFRECVELRIKPLDEGYSGNLVLACTGRDAHGHQQAPYVAKIGPAAAIAAERDAFLQVEAVLGNAAPRIADFGEVAGRGGLRYRYAAMGRGPAVAFQDLYQLGMPHGRVRRVLRAVFAEQLGRLSDAATRERLNLADYYGFDARLSERVRALAAAVHGADSDALAFPGGRTVRNPARFYSDDLPTARVRAEREVWTAFVHGDLNGRNALIEQGNVWLIDWAQANRGHVLRDLAKLENDLLHVWTPLAEDRLDQALALTDALVAVTDLTRPLPAAPPPRVTDPDLVRAYRTVRELRRFHRAVLRGDGAPDQLWWAQLRYAAHTLSFDECSPVQKRWALYGAARCAERLAAT